MAKCPKETSVIIDNGSGTIKAGFSMDSSPRSIFLNMVGRLRHKGLQACLDDKAFYVGSEARRKRGVLEVRAAIAGGRVACWDDLEMVWHHAFYSELTVAPEDVNTLITAPPLIPKKDKEKMTEILFESFNVPAMYLGVQSVLALYSSGRCSGVVVDSGCDSTNVVPIFEGYALPHAITRFPLAGRALTEHLGSLLKKNDCSFTTYSDMEILDEIKQRVCYIAADFEREVKILSNLKSVEAKYKLPDGSEIVVEEQRYLCPEAFFQPSLAGFKGDGIHECVRKSVKKCDSGYQDMLFKNIVLAGGSSLFSGFSDRLVNDLSKMISEKPAVDAQDGRHLGIWTGGSILASLSTFRHCWVFKEDYEEVGPVVIHRKCV